MVSVITVTFLTSVVPQVETVRWAIYVSSVGGIHAVFIFSSVCAYSNQIRTRFCIEKFF